MALSGVRSSWLMLARNCDLCLLATSSCRLLSWISSNSRTFSMAMPAWSAKGGPSPLCGGPELPALCLGILEQPHVLDGDAGLVGQGRRQLDLPLAKRSNVRAQ